jgi:hypothetical protein
MPHRTYCRCMIPSLRAHMDRLGLKSVIGLRTAQTYEALACMKGAEVLTDELPEGAKLYCIGPWQVDRVIFYFPGTPITHQRLYLFF